MATQKQMKESGLVFTDKRNVECINNCRTGFVITKKSVIECADCGKQVGTLYCLPVKEEGKAK